MGKPIIKKAIFLMERKLKNFLMEHIYHLIPDILMIGVYI